MPKYVRTKWTPEARETLEAAFARDPFPPQSTRAALAAALRVPPRNVQVWFQNQRQRGGVRKAPLLPRALPPVLAVPWPVPPPLRPTVEDVRLLADAWAREEPDGALGDAALTSIAALLGAAVADVRDTASLFFRVRGA